MKTFYSKSLVILSLSLIFAFSSFAQETKKITLDDIYKSRKFNPKGVYGMQSMADGEHYTLVEGDSLNVYSYNTGKYVKTIVTGKELIPEGDTVPIGLGGYEFSKDEKKILFPTETESIYRYSSKSNFYYFDLETRKLHQLSRDGKQRLPEFSPDGTKIAYVRDNNLYIKYLDQDLEIRVTPDGEFNKIIYGTTDWVYEEEFAITKGFQWSPDSKRIAFYRFDESNVKEFSLTDWGELYPTEYKYKYPKAGEDNSLVSILIYTIENQQTVTVDVGPERDQYIPRIYWTKDPNKLVVLRLNRLQNRLDFLLSDVKIGKTRIFYSEDNKYYIEESHYDHVIFIDTVNFLITSERDGYYHIYLMPFSGEKGKQLTYGFWDVSEVYGYDPDSKLVYFQAASVSPMNREICSVDLNQKMKIIADEPGWNDASFSANFQYYLGSFSDANTPPRYTINKSNGKVLRTLENNDALDKIRKEYNFSKTEFFTFTTSENVTLNGYMIKPPNFDQSKKYPVLFDIYGGPGSQTVVNRFPYGGTWHQMLAQNGYIIVSIDNRGTGFRGEEFKKMTYQQLGKYETMDMIEAAKYMGSLPYVDASRIGVWGWSFGGYMSSLCITKGADYFKMAIAVAPVTNWRYYDNIYTERFMRKPQDNAEGYDSNSPISHVDKLKGKYLIIHGSSDDNVHFQNTMDMITALVKANKQFDLMVYPNKNHGIYGGNTRLHLYTLLTDYILENL